MWGDFFVWRGHILRFVPFSYLSFTSLTLSFSDATIKRNIKRFHKSCKPKHNHQHITRICLQADMLSEMVLNLTCTLGCPSLTCFFENKKVQPISVVFGGWFEVSQKDF